MTDHTKKPKEPKKCSYCGFASTKYTYIGHKLIYCSTCHKKTMQYTK